MATYLVTDPQTGKKLKLTGDSPPTEQELNQIFSSQPKSALQKVDSAILSIPGMKTVNEAAAGFNRGVAGMVDTFVTKPLNTIAGAVGIDRQIPSASDQVAPKGSFAGPGMVTDIASAAGETAAMSLGAGATIRGVANALPRTAQSTGANVVRRMGSTTAAQDAGYGALSGAGAETGKEVGGKTGEFVGSLAAPALPSLIRSGGAEIVRQAIRGGRNNVPAMNAALDDAARSGARLSAGEATGRPAVQATENISSKLAGGGPIQAAKQQSSDGIQARLADISDQISGTRGAEAAGRTIKNSITGTGGFIDRFQGQSGVLWNAADNAIGVNNMIPINNTRGTLGKLVKNNVLSDILNNPKLVQIREALGNVSDIDYGTLRELRSDIGRRLASNELVSDVPRAELKQLYGAISQDIRDEATRAGPAAMRAFNRANAYTRSGHERIDGFIENVMKKADFTKVYDAVTRGGEGSQVINSFKRSMNPEEWEVVVSNVVRNLGKATPGQQGAEGVEFSVNKFLTDWNKLGPAKRALFSGSRTLDHYGRDLDAIARTAERIKVGGASGSNPSGTGQFLANVGAVSALAGSAGAGNMGLFGAVLGGIAGNNAYARLMTNPRFVSWLAGTTKSADIGPQLAKLTAMQKNMPLEDAQTVDQLIQELEQDGEQ